MVNTTAITDYRQQAREFLNKARDYLAQDDLHQASEKGWGAAAWMAKAVAEAQGWEYESHNQFNIVLNNAAGALFGRSHPTYGRVHELSGIARALHQNFYTRKQFLDSRGIGINLDNVEELLGILEPLTETEA